MSHIAYENKKLAAKVVVGNWKMYGSLQVNAQLISDFLPVLSDLQHTQIVICPPYPYLAQMQALLQDGNIAWGAQNMGKFKQGAHTGEVSADMLRDFGCRYVILGHSERSTAYCESDENIAEKFMRAKISGLIPILCVGETLIEREAGVMELVVGQQLDTIIKKYGASVFADSIISYEPIWAIGTGLAASPTQVEAMHTFIRQKVSQTNADAENGLKILYGGSVNPQNALQLFAVKNVDGGLVGKCSLHADAFVNICQAAENSHN